MFIEECFTRWAAQSFKISYIFAGNPIVFIGIPRESFCFRGNLIRFFVRTNFTQVSNRKNVREALSRSKVIAGEVASSNRAESLEFCNKSYSFLKPSLHFLIFQEDTRRKESTHTTMKHLWTLPRSKIWRGISPNYISMELWNFTSWRTTKSFWG